MTSRDSATHEQSQAVRFLEECAKHTALNLGQALQGMRNWTSHPDADERAPSGTLRHVALSFVLRSKRIANDLFFATIPPHWHHTRAEIEVMTRTPILDLPEPIEAESTQSEITTGSATGGGSAMTCDADDDSSPAEGTCQGQDCADDDPNVVPGQLEYFPYAMRPATSTTNAVVTWNRRIRSPSRAPICPWPSVSPPTMASWIRFRPAEKRVRGVVVVKSR